MNDLGVQDSTANMINRLTKDMYYGDGKPSMTVRMEKVEQRLEDQKERMTLMQTVTSSQINAMNKSASMRIDATDKANRKQIDSLNKAIAERNESVDESLKEIRKLFWTIVILLVSLLGGLVVDIMRKPAETPHVAAYVAS